MANSVFSPNKQTTARRIACTFQLSRINKHGALSRGFEQQTMVSMHYQIRVLQPLCNVTVS